MTRKEIYSKIKSMNLAEEVKKTYGDNYTRVSSKNLEEFIASKSKKASKPSTKKVDKKPVKAVKPVLTGKPVDLKEAFVKLISVLTSVGVLGKQDADFILRDF